MHGTKRSLRITPSIARLSYLMFTEDVCVMHMFLLRPGLLDGGTISSELRPIYQGIGCCQAGLQGYSSGLYAEATFSPASSASCRLLILSAFSLHRRLSAC